MAVKDSEQDGDGASIGCPAIGESIKVTDQDVGYSYIEFPENTIFMGSFATNSNYRKGVAYIPVQQLMNGTMRQSHIYEIRPNMKTAKHIVGPIRTPSGSMNIRVFGCALDSQGILYLCANNRNSLLAIDLNKILPNPTNGPDRHAISATEKVTCFMEVNNIPCPYGVTIDPKNETNLYVTGGSFGSFATTKLGNPEYGRVYRIHMAADNKKTNPIKSLHTSNLSALAGIQVVEDELWIGQLYNILRQDKLKSNDSPQVVWNGFDKNDQCWLASNIDVVVFSQNKNNQEEDNNNTTANKSDHLVTLSPIYHTVPKSTVSEVKKGWLGTVLQHVSHKDYKLKMPLFAGKDYLTTRQQQQEEDDNEIDKDPINNNNNNSPIRLMFCKTTSTKKKNIFTHFEIDLVETRKNNKPSILLNKKTGKTLGKRHYFDEQITHAGHIRFDNTEKDDEDMNSGYIVCIHCKQPRILLLKDTIFKNVILAEKGVLENTIVTEKAEEPLSPISIALHNSSNVSDSLTIDVDDEDDDNDDYDDFVVDSSGRLQKDDGTDDLDEESDDEDYQYSGGRTSNSRRLTSIFNSEKFSRELCDSEHQGSICDSERLAGSMAGANNRYGALCKEVEQEIDELDTLMGAIGKEYNEAINGLEDITERDSDNECIL